MDKHRTAQKFRWQFPSSTWQATCQATQRRRGQNNCSNYLQWQKNMRIQCSWAILTLVSVRQQRNFCHFFFCFLVHTCHFSSPLYSLLLPPLLRSDRFSLGDGEESDSIDWGYFVDVWQETRGPKDPGFSFDPPVNTMAKVTSKTGAYRCYLPLCVFFFHSLSSCHDLELLLCFSLWRLFVSLFCFALSFFARVAGVSRRLDRILVKSLARYLTPVSTCLIGTEPFLVTVPVQHQQQQQEQQQQQHQEPQQQQQVVVYPSDHYGVLCELAVSV